MILHLSGLPATQERELAEALKEQSNLAVAMLRAKTTGLPVGTAEFCIAMKASDILLVVTMTAMALPKR